MQMGISGSEEKKQGSQSRPPDEEQFAPGACARDCQPD